MACGALAFLGIAVTGSPFLWAACALSLPLSLEIAGGRGIKPIVAACLGLLWVAIFSSIVSADLNSLSLDNIPAEFDAIVNSLLALFAVALGYRIGARLFDADAAEDYKVSFNTRKLSLAYWCSFFASACLAGIASFVPSLTQPILAIRGIELLLLYVFSAQIFASREHYVWLLAAVLAEIALGATGYIASYQVPLIVILAAALNSNSVQLRPGQIIRATAVGIPLLWMSLVWSAIKPEYRFWLATEDPHVTEQTSERVEWIVDRITSGSVNYTDAAIKLANRIGYTHFYAAALPRMESSNYQSTSYWRDAVENILKPRFLFPDKPILDDTRITSEMTGVQFGDAVSVSVGYIAQAHSDFGFPLMYLPLALVGISLGAVGAYFQSRKASKFVKDGFMAAALVFKFTYESNIDKAVGGFALSTLALLFTFWLLYPPFERWASDEA